MIARRGLYKKHVSLVVIIRFYINCHCRCVKDIFFYFSTFCMYFLADDLSTLLWNYSQNIFIFDNVAVTLTYRSDNRPLRRSLSRNLGPVSRQQSTRRFRSLSPVRQPSPNRYQSHPMTHREPITDPNQDYSRGQYPLDSMKNKQEQEARYWTSGGSCFDVWWCDLVQSFEIKTNTLCVYINMMLFTLLYTLKKENNSLSISDMINKTKEQGQELELI